MIKPDDASCYYYTFAGKAKLATFDKYLEVTLAEARERKSELRRTLQETVATQLKKNEKQGWPSYPIM